MTYFLIIFLRTSQEGFVGDVTLYFKQAGKIMIKAEAKEMMKKKMMEHQH